MRIERQESEQSEPGRDERSVSDPSPDAQSSRLSDEPVYVISVAAKLVGMPAWTLRVLDEQGIVSPLRTDKNRRLYSDRDLIRLARVRTLTEIEGVNMNGVRLILKLEEEREHSAESSSRSRSNGAGDGGSGAQGE